MPHAVRLGREVIAVFCLIGGFAMQWNAIRRFGGATMPRYPSLNPRHWKPVWRMRSDFTSETGYDRFIWGDVLLVLGAVIGVVVFTVGH